MSQFKQTLNAYSERVNNVLRIWLPEQEGCSALACRLQSAMSYCVFNGGKRVRPILAYAAAEAVSGISEYTDSAAAALECMHAYSLVHDDLPAMDDDDLRRGKPTCHIQFDEATAILAGDALQTLGFEKLSELNDDRVAIALIRELSAASGASGMAGGQMLDLLAEGQSSVLQINDLEAIHNAKTGALIRAAVRMGAISVGADDRKLTSLTAYAAYIGLAFQVQDDIIDLCSDTDTLGKQQGADLERNKSTYVSILGLDGAKEKTHELIESAKAELENAELEDSCFLSAFADYVIFRKY